MKKLFLPVLALVMTWACTSDTIEPFADDDDCSEVDVSLSSDIVPIIEQNCATSGCHLDRQSPLLNTSEAIIQNAARVRARSVAGTMPPSGPLAGDLVSQINCWVENGAQDN